MTVTTSLNTASTQEFAAWNVNNTDIIEATGIENGQLQQSANRTETPGKNDAQQQIMIVEDELEPEAPGVEEQPIHHSLDESNVEVISITAAGDVVNHQEFQIAEESPREQQTESQAVVIEQAPAERQTNLEVVPIEGEATGEQQTDSQAVAIQHSMAEQQTESQPVAIEQATEEQQTIPQAVAIEQATGEQHTIPQAVAIEQALEELQTDPQAVATEQATTEQQTSPQPVAIEQASEEQQTDPLPVAIEQATVEQQSDPQAVAIEQATVEQKSDLQASTTEQAPTEPGIDSQASTPEQAPTEPGIDPQGVAIEQAPTEPEIDSQAVTIEQAPTEPEIDSQAVGIEQAPTEQQSDSQAVVIEQALTEQENDPQAVGIEQAPTEPEIDPQAVVIEPAPIEQQSDPRAVAIEQARQEVTNSKAVEIDFDDRNTFVPMEPEFSLHGKTGSWGWHLLSGEEAAQEIHANQYVCNKPFEHCCLGQGRQQVVKMDPHKALWKLINTDDQSLQVGTFGDVLKHYPAGQSQESACTFAFFGDSLSSDSAMGAVCEALRMGYTLKSCDTLRMGAMGVYGDDLHYTCDENRYTNEANDENNYNDSPHFLLEKEDASYCPRVLIAFELDTIHGITRMSPAIRELGGLAIFNWGVHCNVDDGCLEEHLAGFLDSAADKRFSHWRFMFREHEPQHFPFPGGLYPSHLPKVRPRHHRCHKFSGRMNNWRNLKVPGILEARNLTKQVSIIPISTALEPLIGLHYEGPALKSFKGDCSHYVYDPFRLDVTWDALVTVFQGN